MSDPRQSATAIQFPLRSLALLVLIVAVLLAAVSPWLRQYNAAQFIFGEVYEWSAAPGNGAKHIQHAESVRPVPRLTTSGGKYASQKPAPLPRRRFA